MNFNGRWIPIEVMDTVVALWAIAVILVGVALFYLRRKDARNRHEMDSPRAKSKKRRDGYRRR